MDKKFPGRMLKNSIEWDSDDRQRTSGGEEISQDEENLVLRLIHSHVEKGNFSEVYKLIQNGKFNDNLRMIDLWDETHYSEKERSIRRPLTPLMRFRIRQRYPPPHSICPNGIRKTLSLPLRAKLVLGSWYESHKTNPFPNRFEKEILAHQSGLTLTQVQTWFANLRRRKLKTSNCYFTSWSELETPSNQLSNVTSSDSSSKRTEQLNYNNYDQLASYRQSDEPLDLSLTGPFNNPIQEPNKNLKELLSKNKFPATSKEGEFSIRSSEPSISSLNLIKKETSVYVQAASVAFPGYFNPEPPSPNSNIDRPGLSSSAQVPYYWRRNYDDEISSNNRDVASPEDLRLPVSRNRNFMKK